MNTPIQHKTIHAIVQMQRRAVKEQDVTLLVEYGASQYSWGCQVIAFTRSGWDRLISDNQQGLLNQKVSNQILERLRKKYLVISNDGGLVTAGHRHKGKSVKKGTSLKRGKSFKQGNPLTKRH